MSSGTRSALSDGNILSWSGDFTLRLWDGRSGKCLFVFKGHSSSVSGACTLSDGKILSWSEDGTLRLWDGQSGRCLRVLEGHSAPVTGVRDLADGRVLSWSLDTTMRLWDAQSGVCLKALKGHTASVRGTFILPDGRLLSWAGGDDNTLRLWDGERGICLKVLGGQCDSVSGVLALSDDRLLSWSDDWDSKDHTFRLWDAGSGRCVEWVPDDQVATFHPEWLHERANAKSHERVVRDFFGDALLRSAHLRLRTVSSPLASWQTDSYASVRCLLPDGTTVVTQANGQVCFLKLHYGNRRFSLAEAEELIGSQGKKAE